MTSKTVKNTNQPSPIKDLALLFAIPVIIAVFVAIAVYTPRLLANPKYDFIYSVCSNYYCRYDFNVDSSGRVTQYNLNQDYDNDTTTLRYYNAMDDSTRSLTLDEAKHYQLDTSSKSPDGYSLTIEDRDSGLLFWRSYDSSWYLKNGAKKKKVELSTNGTYYSQNIKFIGWINK